MMNMMYTLITDFIIDVSYDIEIVEMMPLMSCLDNVVCRKPLPTRIIFFLALLIKGNFCEKNGSSLLLLTLLRLNLAERFSCLQIKKNAKGKPSKLTWTAMYQMQHKKVLELSGDA
ncbi:uncharacterized protein LOC118484727 isoform X2 [Helianthus annuus]|uniref:uncharacterized protein LOC118484727 isoform X2 n=1 Tax=Helianthus annuus TaxID=4232 RepID=UPI001652EF00|nr:uncharacterized protein LOC118484727 isoform X2 [Helianthus annuus]XP_035836511.1 uncharacterized protein LOC118484727 isoform X2 [Helianthus annuus]XP_035836512.1 uncharacterized protein LOC118484727 isoform X2 [Helianthus annuus]XP_035836513.1 uncharacterized protein LOC118484727 isoform X2 [Helianthus annuus]XP_035836514.1 uncharacterized protein LOC118484727 isoform X2 [Helianthus annuus]XP_035836515.1 uncharacterized protein LOC118484727 isoform X2 [Helianthus annuus]